MATNKALLMKGIRYLAIAVPLMFIGPTIINSSFKNEGHPFFVPILGIGITFCAAAVYFIFKGIQTMVKSLFDGDK